MKKLKTIILMCVMILSLGFVSCNNETVVSIESFTGEAEVKTVEKNDEPVVKKKRQKILVDVTSDSTEPTEEPKSPDGTYVLVYNNETTISLTIKLNNPKGESIDAIQLSCEDLDAQILTSDGSDPIAINQDGKGAGGIVNWAQENPYNKTFSISTKKSDEVYDIKVIDIKVNGTWQHKPLDNNKLVIYRLDDAFSLKPIKQELNNLTLEFENKDPNFSNFVFNDGSKSIALGTNKETLNIGKESEKQTLSFDVNVDGDYVASRTVSYDFKAARLVSTYDRNRGIELKENEFVSSMCGKDNAQVGSEKIYRAYSIAVEGTSLTTYSTQYLDCIKFYDEDNVELDVNFYKEGYSRSPAYVSSEEIDPDKELDQAKVAKYFTVTLNNEVTRYEIVHERDFYTDRCIYSYIEVTSDNANV